MNHKKHFGFLIAFGPKGSSELKGNGYCTTAQLKTINLLHIALNINIIKQIKSQLLTVVFQMS